MQLEYIYIYIYIGSLANIKQVGDSQIQIKKKLIISNHQSSIN
jgi:hypothetical protein